MRASPPPPTRARPSVARCSSRRCCWRSSASSRPAGRPRPGLRTAGKARRHPGQARPRPGQPERAGGIDRRTERGDRLDDRRSLGPAPEAGRGRSRTGRKAGELDRATAALRSRSKRTWKGSAPSSTARSAVLRERLVAIYEAGSPDVVNAILESASWAEVQRPDRIPQPDPELRRLGRRTGQDAARRGHRRGRPARRRTAPRSKTPRDAVAAIEREVAAAASAEAEARFAELKVRAGRAPAKRWKRSKSRRTGAQRQPLLDHQPDRLRNGATRSRPAKSRRR